MKHEDGRRSCDACRSYPWYIITVKAQINRNGAPTAHENVEKELDICPACLLNSRSLQLGLHQAKEIK